MAKIRLDKFVSSQSGLSRKEARIAVWKGRVLVDGQAVLKPDASVDTDCAIQLDGQSLVYKPYVYFMLNKPKGIVSATRDKAAKTVLDLLPEHCKKLQCSPVGRLDRDTTGLLLLTNDGDFLHRVISPNQRIEKSYLVTLDAAVPPTLVAEFAQGIVLADGTQCREAKLEILQACQARVVITEGKYHQIKRMFGVAGLGVVELHRERIGALYLEPDLPSGAVKELTAENASKVFA
ncbi:MAG: pseudouridine synthase [Clostridia bacterium]|nr:pseudouridine synthase [Clostridia bacterium]